MDKDFEQISSIYLAQSFSEEENEESMVAECKAIAKAYAFTENAIVSMGDNKQNCSYCYWLCLFVGQLSFPLYITHYPILYMHMSWAENHMDSPVSTHVFVGITTLIMCIGVAWACLKLVDEPARAWLKEHWLRRNSK